MWFIDICSYWLSVRQYSDINLAAVWWRRIIASTFRGLGLFLLCPIHIYSIDFFVDMKNAFSQYKTIYSTWYNNAKNHWLTYKKAIHFNRTNTLPFHLHNYNRWFSIYLQLYNSTSNNINSSTSNESLQIIIYRNFLHFFFNIHFLALNCGKCGNEQVLICVI